MKKITNVYENKVTLKLKDIDGESFQSKVQSCSDHGSTNIAGFSSNWQLGSRIFQRLSRIGGLGSQKGKSLFQDHFE